MATATPPDAGADSSPPQPTRINARGATQPALAITFMWCVIMARFWSFKIDSALKNAVNRSLTSRLTANLEPVAVDAC
jgi:hypothetical protein